MVCNRFTIFETGTQAQLVIPMAASLTFGIVFATLITLILIPALCLVLDDFAIWWKETWRHVLPGSKDDTATLGHTVDSGVVPKQQPFEP